MNHTDEQLPAPPREFFTALNLGKARCLWVKCARRLLPGMKRYIVTEPHGSKPLFATDDVQELTDWLRERA